MTCGRIDLECAACRLSATRTRVVPGNGPCRSKIVFFGEAPGKEEDEQGTPFVGRAGKLLDEALTKSGVKRSQVYVGNIVKCRPPRNRRPRGDEVRTCASMYLDSEIEAVRPTVICALGQTAANWFLPMKDSMSDRIGKTVEMYFNGMRVTFIAAYHPAACLYQRRMLAAFQRDIRKALRAARMA